MKNIFLRDFFADAMPKEIRSEIVFGKSNNDFYKNFLQSDDFSNFVSKFSEDDFQSLMRFRSECLLEANRDLEFFNYLSKDNNFNKYTHSFPPELHANIGAFERLKMFEQMCLKDPAFFSIFAPHLTYEYRIEVGQTELLCLENLPLLDKNELSLRLHVAILLEKHGQYLPIELRNLIYNCEELINLRRNLLINPEFINIRKDIFLEDVFAQLTQGREDVDAKVLQQPKPSPQVCPSPLLFK